MLEEEMAGTPPPGMSFPGEEAPMQAPPEAPMQGAPQGAPPQGAGGEQFSEEEAPQDAGSGEIQEEFNRGIAAVGKVLYQEQEMSDKILGMVNETEKVGSAAKAVVFLVTQVDAKLDIFEPAIAAITVFAADRLLELVDEDARSQIQYTDIEAQQVVMTSMEMILQAYGVSQERAASVGQGMSEADVSTYQKTYEDTLNG